MVVVILMLIRFLRLALVCPSWLVLSVVALARLLLIFVLTVVVVVALARFLSR